MMDAEFKKTLERMRDHHKQMMHDLEGQAAYRSDQDVQALIRMEADAVARFDATIANFTSLAAQRAP